MTVRLPGTLAARSITVASAAPALTVARGSDVALRSLQHLQQAREEPALVDRLRRGVAVALLGVTMLTAFTPPAHADTTQVAAPQTTEWVQPPSTGPPTLDVIGASSTLPAFVAAQQARPQQAVVDSATRAALDRFEQTVTRVLHHDAASLASGLTPVAPGGALDAQQQQAIEGAFKDLVKGLPLGALAPDFAAAIEGLMDGAGLDHGPLMATRVGDLGRVGGEAARQLVDRVKDGTPGAYWTMVGVGAAAGVVVGYTHGTDALARVGIKPEFSTKIFGDSSTTAKLRLGLQAGPQLSDPRLVIGASASRDLGNGVRVQGRVDGTVGGSGFRSLQLQGAQMQASLSSARTSLGASVQVDGHGQPFDARLSASHAWENASGTATLGGAAQWSRDGGSSVSVSLSGTQDGWTYAAAGTYRAHDRDFTATLSAGRQFSIGARNDAEVQIRATHSNHGPTTVGVGATWRF